MMRKTPSLLTRETTEAGAMPGAIDTNVKMQSSPDAFVADQVKEQALDDELPLDVKITHKLKPHPGNVSVYPTSQRKVR